MAQRDDFGLQSQRIVDAVRKMCLRCTVTLDNSRAPHWIKFRIDDGSTLLTKAHPEFHAYRLFPIGLYSVRLQRGNDLWAHLQVCQPSDELF